jgi:hypothetical protein
MNGGAVLGYEKRKGRDWLENSGGYNFRQPQANATLEKAIVYDTHPIRNPPEILFSGKEPAKQDTIEVDGTDNDTERYVFNYVDVPEGVETLKRTYSPFISYTYKALPMLLHTTTMRPGR